MFHNLQSYDSHLILQELGKYNFKINDEIKTIEKYASFTFKEPGEKGIEPGLLLVFIDSILFKNNSLNDLDKNLGENEFYHLSQDFNANTLDLVMEKGYFPYTGCNSCEKFMEGLPSKEKFYKSLINHAISDKNYEHVLNVQRAFKMYTMKDYHDLYLKVNVLLLTCVFETFEKRIHNSFELDPAYYLSTPGYS